MRMKGSSTQSVRTTRLAADLSAASPKPVPTDLFKLARKRWLAGERVDLGALAAELGIARATAFRWVGSRELLLGEIVWSVCVPLLDQAVSATRAHGARRVALICAAAIRGILAFAPLRQFIHQAPEFAMRLLTSKHSPVQARIIERLRELVQHEADRGTLELALPADTLAYLIVRIAESFVYADFITDQEINSSDAALAIELLLSGRVQA